MAGFRRFREQYFEKTGSNHSLYQKLASLGQTPKTLIIGCSDSRADPAILTDASPGELFVVRNVANIVPPCEPATLGFHGTSSAIEFAVKGLQVENIIVLGHRQCGGIKALLDGSTKGFTYIDEWMKIAERAKETVLSRHPGSSDDKLWRLTEMEAIRVSLENLLSFPFVQKARESGSLTLYGIYFDLEQGALWQLDDEFKEFRQLAI